MRIVGLLSKMPLPVILMMAGWYGGAKLGAPDFAISAVDNSVSQAARFASALIGGERDAPDGENAESNDSADAQVKPEPATAGRQAPAPAGRQATDKSTQAAAAGADPANLAIQITDLADSALVAAPLDLPVSALSLCNMKVSNAPRTTTDGFVTGFTDSVQLNGVSLMLLPATKACLSSGFGPRGYAPHRGVDFYSDQGGDVLAAADGVIREAKRRDDYGNMIVIDHGDGVFTRYAHLASFASSVREGVGVRRGQRLGPIGDTGRAGAVHLHYEVRVGNYNTHAGAFGLTPLDPFSLADDS